MEHIENIGSTIRFIREAMSLSLDELAARCGLTPSHIGRIERGEQKNPTIGTLQKIALALNISLIELISDDYLDKYRSNREEVAEKKEASLA